MANRVIKDSIWSSPTLSKLPVVPQLHWPRWLLMADDWGCFNADPDIVQGLVYPKMKIMTLKKIQNLIEEYYQAGLLFLWKDESRTWGYFVSWDTHHNYCNKTNVDNEGKHQKHRRKTPEPPKDEVLEYIKGVRSTLEHLRTPSDKILSPIPIPNPKPIHKPLVGKFENIWTRYPLKDGKKDAERHFNATVETEEDWQGINKALNNYLKHLQTETWKKPKNGSTWFNNWRDWIDWKEIEASGGAILKVCTAKELAPQGEADWRHPDTKEVTNKESGDKADRCIHCKKVFPKS